MLICFKTHLAQNAPHKVCDMCGIFTVDLLKLADLQMMPARLNSHLHLREANLNVGQMQPKNSPKHRALVLNNSWGYLCIKVYTAYA